MTTAITALTTSAQTTKNPNAKASAEPNNADQTSFGTLLHQSVAVQNKTADKSNGKPAATDTKTEDAAKSADPDKDETNTKTDTTTQDASAALLQALAALGLAPANAAIAGARAARSASTDATNTDGATDDVDGATRTTGTRADNAAIELGANAKAALKNNPSAMLARTTSDASDAASAGAANADVAARTDASKADLTARLSEALRAAAEGEGKSTVSSTDTNATPRFADVVSGLSVVGAATNSATSTSTTATQQTIHSKFGSAAWANEVTEQVRSFTLQKIEVAELKLNPQDLGPIRVEIALDQGNAAIHFSAARDDVRDALAQNIGNLRDSLANAGVSLQNASTGNFGDGQAFGYMQRQASNGGNRSGGRGDAATTNDTPTVAAATTHATRRSSADGVDLFA
jgi:flagellar hook-length control protein FliK